MSDKEVELDDRVNPKTGFPSIKRRDYGWATAATAGVLVSSFLLGNAIAYECGFVRKHFNSNCDAPIQEPASQKAVSAAYPLPKAYL